MIFGSKHVETGKFGSWNIEQGTLWFLDQNIERQGKLGFSNIKKLSYDFWIKTCRDRKVQLFKYKKAILWFLDQNM